MAEKYKPEKKPLKPSEDTGGKWQAVLYYMRKKRRAKAAS